LRLAIFDIDGTLVRGSSEWKFWWYLARRGRQGPRQLSAYLLFLIRYLPIEGVRALRRNKAYLCGLEAGDVGALARDFVAERLMQELYPPALRRLRDHLARGDTVVLMSGTLYAIARALADRLGVRRVCATIACQRGGVFRPAPPECHPYDTEKLALAMRLANELGFDPGAITAYGNSVHDLHLFVAVGQPIAVRPDAKLMRIAGGRGWEIIDERSNVNRAVAV
jgi:HAD superfamily hydrolase (TIGR01490 family)